MRKVPHDHARPTEHLSKVVGDELERSIVPRLEKERDDVAQVELDLVPVEVRARALVRVAVWLPRSRSQLASSVLFGLVVRQRSDERARERRGARREERTRERRPERAFLSAAAAISASNGGMRGLRKYRSYCNHQPRS